MGIYKRDNVSPEWEPVLWTMKGRKADQQELGFHERAQKPIHWQKIDWNNFPEEGIFGLPDEWFRERDIVAFAIVDGEEILLIQNSWFGFPDPPEWGLVARAQEGTEEKWQHWGHFPDLPGAWRFD